MPVDPQHHQDDPQAGQHFDERIQPEAEQSQGFVFRAEIDRKQAFEDVIDDRQDTEPKGIPIVSLNISWGGLHPGDYSRFG